MICRRSGHPTSLVIVDEAPRIEQHLGLYLPYGCPQSIGTLDEVVRVSEYWDMYA